MKVHRMSLLIFIVALILFAVGNGSLPITDPVESNYALTAKEMVQSGNWLSPQIYHHFWYDKPIMIYWLIGLAYKVFGFGAFAARLPSAVFGALSLALFYQITKTVSKRRILSLIAVVVMATSLEFWLLSRGIVTDMVLFFCTVGTMGYAYRGLLEKKAYLVAVAYGFAALGVLTKGPVAIVLPGVLLLLFALSMRSWDYARRLFPWQGILVFLIIAAPWYVYMYQVHGDAFLNGFIGLNNVVRATESEHPKDNHWWYYLVTFIVGTLPWTGAIIYAMIKGWKHKLPEYRYTMIWGWGTIFFYSLMATKYITYTFISLIPFSLLAAVGIVRLLHLEGGRKAQWFLIAPAFILWFILCLATRFVPWGFWLLLYVLTLVGIVVVIVAFISQKRYTIPVAIALTTLATSFVVLHEGIMPYLEQRSAVGYASTVSNFNGPVYVYNGYDTSLVFYSGHDVSAIQENMLRPHFIVLDKDGKEAKGARSKAWNGKYTYPVIKSSALLQDIESGEKAMIIVDDRDYEMFLASPLYKGVKYTAKERVGHQRIFMVYGKPKKQM